MSEPKRWVDDPEADRELSDVLRGAGPARRLDEATRRRLGAKVARASALPAVAAGWLFAKSAAAALVAVVGTASVATFTGVIAWPTARPAAPAVSVRTPARAPASEAGRVMKAPRPDVVPEAALVPQPALPAPTSVQSSPAPSSSASLAAESLLLEQARRELRRAPAVALQIAAEHAQRFRRPQLAAERTLIQVEALHRLGRDAEARTLARGLLDGTSGGLYAERVRQLLGEDGAR